MNYCTIQDAWGNNNEFSNQYKSYMNNKDNKNNMQISQNNKSMITDVSSLNIPLNTEHFNSNTINPNTLYHINNCANFIEHIRTCKECRAKMRDYFKPKIIEKMNDIIEDNKDIIVLILIGLSILLFFNMINNITK
jgi:hypothetical protein